VRIELGHPAPGSVTYDLRMLNEFRSRSHGQRQLVCLEARKFVPHTHFKCASENDSSKTWLSI